MTTTTTINDPLFQVEVSKPVIKAGKMFINPFGVVLGNNISGQDRADDVLKEKDFMRTTERFGIIQPVIVQQILLNEGPEAYGIVAGNRRTAALRDVIGRGVWKLGLDDPRALMPIYEMNVMDMEGITSQQAVNLLENSMRKRLDPISKAHAIEDLITNGANVDEISYLMSGPGNKPIGKEAIRQYRQLLKLHPSVQTAIAKGTIAIQTSKASQMALMPPEEQLQVLQQILEAQGYAKNKHNTAADVIKKAKAEKREDVEGQRIYDQPRSSIEARRTFAELSKVESWDCVPKTRKLSNEGYKAVAELFTSLETWMQGGLTAKNSKPDELTLTLRTRILATVAAIAPR